MQYEKRTANHTISTRDSAALNRKLIIVSLSVVAKIYCLGVVIIGLLSQKTIAQETCQQLFSTFIFINTSNLIDKTYWSECHN
jgi:Na+/pantothenate symporter